VAFIDKHQVSIFGETPEKELSQNAEQVCYFSKIWRFSLWPKVGYERKKLSEFRYIHAAVCSSPADILSLSFLCLARIIHKSG
jgi:hypothetical protein